jgi:hypothetical protein
MAADENLRLLSAAIAAREDLRSVILPGLEALEKVATRPETIKSIQQLRAIAWKHADALRFAMKARKPRRRGEIDLPCWSNF